jgi:hypothetical protein
MMRFCLVGFWLILAAPLAAQAPPPVLVPKVAPRATSTPGTYIDRWTLSTSATFTGRVQIASAVTSRAVLEEAASTPNHANRFALAQRVLNEPTFLAVRLSPLIAASIPVTATDHDDDPATPPIVDTTWTDEQLQTLMTQQWNLFASAFVPVATVPGTLAAPGAAGQPVPGVVR